MKLYIFILFTNLIIKTYLFIYKVNTLSYLQKSLRLLSSDNSFLHHINGDSHFLNYYYTSLYLGPNKTRQVYILDTGSSITTSPCDQCTSCGDHLNPKYHLENTSKILSCGDKKCNMSPNSICLEHKCSFRISYAEGSKLYGVYVDQEIYFENINLASNITNISYNMPIGCTTTETHLFKTQLADGIMGLSNNDNSFVSIMYKLGIIQKNIFSLCFEHEGGYFSIGKIYDEYHYDKNIKYVNLVHKNFGNYVIKFKYLKIGEKQVDFNGRAVIDSGTTISYFPPLKFQEIMKIILEKCDKSKKCGNLRKIENFGYCTEVKDEDEMYEIITKGWGNITLKFDDYVFNWTPQNYYYIYRPKKYDLNVCLGFEEEYRSNVLLGTNFMHGYDIIFDKEQQRIGFVQADCHREIKHEEENENNNNDTDINNGLIINTIDDDKNNNLNSDHNNNNETSINNVFISNTINNSIMINNEVQKTNNNISNNDVTNIEKVNDNENMTDINKNLKLIDESNGLDNFMVKLCSSIIFIVIIIFIIFNIILCCENYHAIQGRKDDDDIDKYVMDNFRYDSSNGPISLFNDNI